MESQTIGCFVDERGSHLLRFYGAGSFGLVHPYFTLNHSRTQFVLGVFQGKTTTQSETNEPEEAEKIAQLETPLFEVIDTSLKLNFPLEQEFHEHISRLSIKEMRNLHSWLGTLIQRLEDVEF